MTAALLLSLMLLAAPPATVPATRPLFDHPTTRPAALLVEAFDALPRPDYDPEQAEVDGKDAYDAAYMAEADRRQAEQAAIAKVVADFCPQTPRLGELLAARFNWLARADGHGWGEVRDEVLALRARDVGSDEASEANRVLLYFDAVTLQVDKKYDAAEDVAKRLVAAQAKASGGFNYAAHLLWGLAVARNVTGDEAGFRRLRDELIRRYPDTPSGRMARQSVQKEAEDSPGGL